MDDSVLVDLDVEEPNCYLFQKGGGDTAEEASRPVPSVDSVKCTLCGKCGEVCEFHAIVVLPKEVMVFWSSATDAGHARCSARRMR
jgi:MinD superfamily P-loop ATPase